MDAATPHKVVEIPSVPHDMDGAGPRFLTEFDMVIQWVSDRPILVVGGGACAFATNSPRLRIF